jgi:hypothetical protein
MVHGTFIWSRMDKPVPVAHLLASNIFAGKLDWSNPGWRMAAGPGVSQFGKLNFLVFSSGLFPKPAAIRDLPGVVIRSLPSRSAM